LTDSINTDPIDAAVVRAGLVSTAREVFNSFQRTAMSPQLYEAKDFSISVFDDRLNLVADAPGLPEFVGSLSVALEAMVSEFDDGAALAPGDVIVANDPYVTGGHPADSALIAPAFVGERLVGYVGIRAHVGDLGAINNYPVNSSSVYDEGLRLPPTLICEAGKANERLLAIVATNSRQPHETVGNYRAAAAALTKGTEKVSALAERFGLETYHAAVDQLLDASEHRCRELLSGIPDGTYEATQTLELIGPGQPEVPLHCSVEVSGSDITVDVSRSVDQQPGALNVPLPQTLAACRLALKRLTTQDEVTANSGEYRMLSVVAPPGNIFNAQSPAGSFVMATTASLLGEMVVSALSATMPSRLSAQSGGHTTGFLAWMPEGPRGRPEFLDDIAPIGYGATPSSDGMDALLHFCLAGMELASGEIMEVRCLVAKRRIELVTDSGGAGKHRGGVGTYTEWQLDTDASMMIQAQKTKVIGGAGLAGGMPAGGSNLVILNPGSSGAKTMPMDGGLTARSGDRIAMHGAGGGGYGDPFERTIEAVESDLLNELISPEAALETYGVVVSAETGLADRDATAELRSAPRRAAAADQQHRLGPRETTEERNR
jgi:N-methylhydantoinase B